MKRYSSVTTIAFTVWHDDKTEATKEELEAGLAARVNDIFRSGEIEEATGGELTDTNEETPPPECVTECQRCSPEHCECHEAGEKA